MNTIDIPIIKKAYDLYKIFYEYGKVIPKRDRFILYERSEKLIITVLECLFEASTSKKEKQDILSHASTKLNTLRLFVRLMKDTRSIDTKKYIILEQMIDEIGRMLGGWVRSIVDKQKMP